MFSQISRYVLCALIGILIGIAIGVYLGRNVGNFGRRTEPIVSNISTNPIEQKLETPNTNENRPLSAEEVAQRAKTLYEEGTTSSKAGKYAESVELYKQAIDLKPDYAQAHHELGYASYRLRKYKESVESSEAAIKLRPEPSTYSNLGLAMSALKRWDEAAKAFQKVIDAKPTNAHAYYGLGVAYKNLENNKSAIDALKEAVRLKPDYAAAHYELGLAFLRAEDQISAMHEYVILGQLNEQLAAKLYTKMPEAP